MSRPTIGTTLRRRAERQVEALQSDKARLEARVAELEHVLHLHHGWHQNIGEMGLYMDDNGQWVPVDMSLEYSDSGMCEQTIKALSGSPDPVREACKKCDGDGYVGSCKSKLCPICDGTGKTQTLREAEQAVVKAAVFWLDAPASRHQQLCKALDALASAKAKAKAQEESDG